MLGVSVVKLLQKAFTTEAQGVTQRTTEAGEHRDLLLTGPNYPAHHQKDAQMIRVVIGD
jgi:hypothetical protein